MRDVFVYKNGKIYKDGTGKPLKSSKILGCHNNYKLAISKNCDVFLKESIGASDYADVICKKLCDEVGIECAENDLVIMKDFPSFDDKEMLSFEEYVEFCKSNAHISDMEKIKAFYNNYLENYEKSKIKHALISYDYTKESPYDDAKIIVLSDLVHTYCKVTGEEGTFAIDTYNKIVNEFVDPNSEIGKQMRKHLKIKKKLVLSPDFDLNLKKIALFGYATCQIDMSCYNLHIALIKDKNGYNVDVAPLFDNGESFNLSSFYDEYSMDNAKDVVESSEEYSNALTLTESSGLYINRQLDDLVDELLCNPGLRDFYEKLKRVDIESVCKKASIHEPEYEFIQYSVMSIFEKRMAILEQAYKKKLDSNNKTKKSIYRTDFVKNENIEKDNYEIKK